MQTLIFNNGNLTAHQSRIINNLKDNPKNIKCKPKKDFVADDGEGNEDTWYIDLDIIEECYYYYNQRERDEDFKKLNKLFKN